ncbi:hypothetical protein BsWGS_07036 [Bradybaena similaris]
MVLASLLVLFPGLFGPKCVELGMAFFHSVDVNNNGRLTVAEYERHFRKYDVDGDNRVSEREAAARIGVIDPEVKAYKDVMFNFLDTDGSGYITHSDYQEIVRLIDRDKNGRVDIPEVQEFLNDYCRNPDNYFHNWGKKK